MTDSLRLPKRPFGRTGLDVTPLGLSALGIRFDDIRAGLTPDMVEAAYYEHGITTFFVTWQMTSLAEGVSRLIRAGHRDKLLLISAATIPSGASVHRVWERNARALGADTIDVFLLGWVQARWCFSMGVLSAMRALQAEGKIRALGYSAHSFALAARLAREFNPDVLMIRYNASHRGAEREVFDTLGPERPAIIAYTATRWGMLLKPLPKHGFPTPMAPAECYRFALSHPCVDVALCAARTPEELRDDVAGALQGPLDETRLQEVRRFGDAVHATARGGMRWMFRQG